MQYSMKTVWKIFGNTALAARGFAPAIFVFLFFVFAFAAYGGDDDKGGSGKPNYGAGTEGLAYQLISDGTAWRVRKGTVTDGVVTIPAYYRPDESSAYLPVTEVGAANDAWNAGAFYNTAITGVTFLAPSNITSIGYAAFIGCTALTSVTIPNSVTSIGVFAFIGCTALTSVTIPNSVTSIGDGAFYNCLALTSITVDTANPNYASQNGILYNKAMTTLIQAPASSITGAFTIPNSVTSISVSAFQECTALTSVTIPNSVKTIGSFAFSRCRGLTSVTIPNSVTSIGVFAFRNCTALTSVAIGNSVTSIGSYAFLDCTALTSVTVLATMPPILHNNSILVFLNAPIWQIRVPAARVAAYKAAPSWSAFADRIQAIP